MFREKLPPAFKGLVPGFELRDPDNSSYLSGQVSRKRGVCNNIFQGTLRVRGDYADCRCGGSIDGVREKDFIRFQPLLINNVLLRSEDQPYWIYT